MLYHGSARRELLKKLQNADIVLTTYETMRSDWIAKKALYLEKWHRIILDKGQQAMFTVAVVWDVANLALSPPYLHTVISDL